MDEEDDEDEREDALAVTEVPAAPAPRIETEKDGGEERASAEGEDGEIPPEAGVLNAAAPPLKRQKEVPGADGGMAEDGSAEKDGAASWLDGLTEAVMGANGSVALRRPGAGDVEPAELGGRSKPSGAARADAVMDSLTSEERGLEGLYRQTVQAGRAPTQAAPVEQAGRTMRAEEPGRTAALTVDELDRAVRRDSRRYDGGMTLF